MSTIAVPSHVVGRGGLILTLGILAIVLFGPITGIPGWFMANQDIRDIRSGIIPESEYRRVSVGKTLSIVGTFFNWIFLFIYFVLFFVVGEMLFLFLSML
jgi:hypothetical protein